MSEDDADSKWYKTTGDEVTYVVDFPKDID